LRLKKRKKFVIENVKPNFDWKDSENTERKQIKFLPRNLFFMLDFSPLLSNSGIICSLDIDETVPSFSQTGVAHVMPAISLKRALIIAKSNPFSASLER